MTNTSTLQHLPSFFVEQDIKPMVNRYEIREEQADGSEGRLLATAEQRRPAVKGRVIFFSDAARTRPAFGFRAEQVPDLGVHYAVTTSDGSALGSLLNDQSASALRSSFYLSVPSLASIGRERSLLVALARRFGIFSLRQNFDFTDRATGEPVMSSDKQRSIHDRYAVKVPDERVDFRVAASVSVALDSLLSP